MVTQPVRIAVIGYGWWGKTITRTLATSPLVNVALVVEPDAAVRDIARADGAATGFVVADRLEAALLDRSIQAVVLCTPHKAHAAQIAVRPPPASMYFAKNPCA